MNPRSHRLILLLLALAGCGAEVAALADGAPRQGVSNGDLSVQWIGLDLRPLAVGSNLAVSFQLVQSASSNLDTNGVNVSVQVPAPLVYTVTSNQPDIVSVQDQGNQRLLLSVLSPGSAELTLTAAQGTATYSVLAEEPFSVTFSDLGHLAAGIEPQLPASFALYEKAQERIEALVIDQGGQAMNSWGLTQGRAEGAIAVYKSEPEQFVLSAQPGASVAPEGSGATGTFLAGLASAAGDAGANTLSFGVTLVPSATGIKLEFDSATQTVLAEGWVTDLQTEVFGIDDWVFSCEPSQSCIVDTLSPAAVRLTLPSAAAPGSFTISVSSSSQGLQQSLRVP